MKLVYSNNNRYSKLFSYIYMGWIENAKDMEAWAEKMGDAAEIYSKMSFAESYFGSITTILTWSVLYFAIKSYRCCLPA